MPVRNGADHLLPDEFHPQSGAFGAAGGAEPSLFAGEGDEIFVSADVAPDAREAALGKAAPENWCKRAKKMAPKGGYSPHGIITDKTDFPCYYANLRSLRNQRAKAKNRLKIPRLNKPCGFDSHPGHHIDLPSWYRSHRIGTRTRDKPRNATGGPFRGRVPGGAVPSSPSSRRWSCRCRNIRGSTGSAWR